MTPAARVAAAIEILDGILAGKAVEPALSNWGRANRFAGSKDRAAIRDHVFQALRRRASLAWLGGAQTGRGIMLGQAREIGQEAQLFTGQGHGPPSAGAQEVGRPLRDAPRWVQMDMPEWLLPHFDQAAGPNADRVMQALRNRAPVSLRVNLVKTDIAGARAALAHSDIETQEIIGIGTALKVLSNERRITHSEAYQTGLVELQDAASQSAVLALGISPDMRVLDYCAGGGGKALAMAALGADVTAYDIDPRRMVDLPSRAARAGAAIRVSDADSLELEGFDLVLCDAPCSGSGTWRRTPQAKWALTPERLKTLQNMQRDVVRSGLKYVRKGGLFAYATCSIFSCENGATCEDIAAEQGAEEMLLMPNDDHDGFFLKRLILT